MLNIGIKYAVTTKKKKIHNILAQPHLKWLIYVYIHQNKNLNCVPQNQALELSLL